MKMRPNSLEHRQARERFKKHLNRQDLNDVTVRAVLFLIDDLREAELASATQPSVAGSPSQVDALGAVRSLDNLRRVLVAQVEGTEGTKRDARV